MNVRNAKEEDATTISEIAKVTFPLACPPESSKVELERFAQDHLNTSKFIEIINDSNRVLWVAEEDSRILGFCLLHLLSESKIELSKIYLLPECHGKGVASLLMEKALRYAKNVGAKVVTLSVFHGNNRAISFYKKYGFKKVGSIDFPMGNEIHRDDLMDLVIQHH